jgi:hypothetical protein
MTGAYDVNIEKYKWSFFQFYKVVVHLEISL